MDSRKKRVPPEPPQGPWLRTEGPYLELLGTGHLHLAFQPLVPPAPASAPHSQLASGTAQEHPQLALV